MTNDDTTDDGTEADRHRDRRSQPMTDDIETVEPSVSWQDFDDAEAN